MHEDMDLSTNLFFTHGIDKLCTICHMILKDADRTHSIFSTLEEFESAVNVIQVLQYFSNINIYDGPKMVCGTCYDKTIDVYKFIQMCKKAHENIQNYLKCEREMNAIVKIEESDVSTAGIIVDGRNLAEEVENEKIGKNYEFVISSTDIKIEERLFQEGLDKEETSNNEEIPIADTDIVTVKIEEFDAEIHDERMDLINSKDCLLVFREKKELEAHQKELCNTSFMMKSKLRKHDQRHDAKREQISEDSGINQDQHQPFNDHERDVMCPKCQEVFYNDKQLKIHMKEHHKKTFLCYHCGKVFRTEYFLNTHIRVHNGEKLYTCLICKRGFADSQSLRRHTESHSGEKPHKCELCDQRFTQPATVRSHMAIHYGIKAHKCELCERRFTQAANLRRHMDIHNGVKAHKCEECDRQFTQSSSLRRHMMIHKGIKAHKCEQCGWRFTRAEHLRSHMGLHNITE